jgi:ABC-type glutathione transport system ATPase component
VRDDRHGSRLPAERTAGRRADHGSRHLVLLLLRQLQQALGMAVVFVTHDVGVATEISDRIAVMYGGRLVETGSAREVMTGATPIRSSPRPCVAACAVSRSK